MNTTMSDELQVPNIPSALWPLIARHASLATLGNLACTSALWSVLAREEIERRVSVHTANVVVTQAIVQDAPYAARMFI